MNTVTCKNYVNSIGATKNCQLVHEWIIRNKCLGIYMDKYGNLQCIHINQPSLKMYHWALINVCQFTNIIIVSKQPKIKKYRWTVNMQFNCCFVASIWNCISEFHSKPQNTYCCVSRWGDQEDIQVTEIHNVDVIRQFCASAILITGLDFGHELPIANLS